MNTVLVGAQWGDEGKGKLVDVLSSNADLTVRYQGGSNAGHTVIVGDDTYVFHLLPSAILRKDKISVIGNGVVIDPQALLSEIDGLEQRGISVLPAQLKISANAHVVMPYHRGLDILRESKRKNKIGTTGRGIGPCYSDKINRCGIRMIDLLNPKVLKAKLEDNVKEKNEIFIKAYGSKEFSPTKIFKEYEAYGKRLKPYICDTALFVNRAIDKGKDVLFEGAQGAFLDIDFGTYPFVTSSNTVVGGVCSGAGVAPTRIDRSIACVKAYTTRVGEGPFPAEFNKKMNDIIQAKGNEFGATTGRARRCGWFDSVLVSYAAAIGHYTELAIMKLDVLDELETIKICKAYSYKGKVITDFPLDYDLLTKVKPVYEEMPGWQQDISAIREYKKLPINARRYIERLEKLVGVKVKYVSIGSKRDQIIIR